VSISVPRADAAAASVGAGDLFVFRRVTGNQFVHFGGSGRGAGWAGLVEVSSDNERSLGQALRTRRPVRLEHGGKELVFGPYYARAAAFVPVTNDVVVVFGGDGADLTGSADEALTSAATLAADAIETVTPAKRLADELEELEAVRAALKTPLDAGVGEAARSLGLIAAESLSCELAAIYLEDGDRIVLGEWGWEWSIGPELVAEGLRRVLETGRFPTCVQDATVVPPQQPLEQERSIRSYYLLELTGLARGVLFVAHTDAAPRGFTLLCRRLGLRLSSVLSAQLAIALTQEWSSAEAARLHAEFGKLGAS